MRPYHHLAITSLVLLVWLVAGCTFVAAPNPAMMATVSSFIGTIEKGETDTAYEMLSTSVRLRIDRHELSAAESDFRPVVNAFRKAGIETRGTHHTDELSYYVARLGGREGVLTFVMKQEPSGPKIANIFEARSLATGAPPRAARP